MTRTYNTLRVGSEIVTEIAGIQPDVVRYLVFVTSFFPSIFALSSSSSAPLLM
jgi:hypothetical protein